MRRDSNSTCRGFSDRPYYARVGGAKELLHAYSQKASIHTHATTLPSCSAAAALRHLLRIHSSCLPRWAPQDWPGIKTVEGFSTSVWPGVASKECHDAFLWSLGDARTCHPERTSLMPQRINNSCTELNRKVAHLDGLTW
jgi:hypothetical protein